ncbi:hypothetical protein BJX70DRAFT_409293 [Aspergillus crustosus]
MAINFTPPNSFSQRPLTPPLTGKVSLSRVARIISIFEKHSRGFRQDSWTEYVLDRGEYNELQDQLGKGSNLFRCRKIWYDYEPLESRLSIRMPSPLHEIFWGNGANFAKNINHFASSWIDLPYDSENDKTLYVRREPDASFRHPKARYPGVVIEVCYSQKGRQIPALADDYLLNSNGSINAVVFLDIEYRDKEASYSVWRPCFEVVEREEETELSAACTFRQVSRTPDGLPAESKPLALNLKDFATESEIKEYPDFDNKISISASDLWDYLDFAEKEQRRQERHEGSFNILPKGTRKRRRAKTPPDKINSEDEAVFQALEESDRKRVRDPDYRPGLL